MSDPAVIDEPDQSFKTKNSGPASTTGQESSNSVKTGSAGSSSQEFQPKFDGPADSGIKRMESVDKPTMMTLEQAEAILATGCEEYMEQNGFQFLCE
jgi:hypothetical protein